MSSLTPYSLSLILKEGSFSCVKAANILGFVSHGHLTRQLSKEWGFRPLSDWEKLPTEGRLVLDDSSIAKPHSKSIEGIHTLGLSYVSRMCSNRIFNGQAIESHSFQGAQGQIGKLKGVYAQVQIAKHGDRYLVTNELTPHTSRSLAGRYGERGVVETVFRDWKTVLYLEKCSCRNLEAQFNHGSCVLEAYLQPFRPSVYRPRSKSIYGCTVALIADQTWTCYFVRNSCHMSLSKNFIKK